MGEVFFGDIVEEWGEGFGYIFDYYYNWVGDIVLEYVGVIKYKGKFCMCFIG